MLLFQHWVPETWLSAKPIKKRLTAMKLKDWANLRACYPI